MSFVPRPHISAALQHLRFSISAAALALGLALSAQIVIWSLVHFTEVRTTEFTEEANQGPLKVVRAPAVIARKDPSAAEKPGAKSAAPPPPAESSAVAAADPAKPVHHAATGPRPEPADVNAVQSTSDVMLKRGATVVQSFGVLAAIILGALMFQGVVIAAGAGVPGVEKAVTAGTWSLLICLLCLPLKSLVPDIAFSGIFLSYDSIVIDSAAYRAQAPGAPGPMGFFGAHLVLPAVFLLGLILVVMRFRSGIEAGVIVTSVSQLDEKLEREIRAMKLGQLAIPRAVGALHSAIGDTPVLSAHLQPAAGAEALIAAQRAAAAVAAADPNLRLRGTPAAGGKGVVERPILDPTLTDSNRRPI